MKTKVLSVVVVLILTLGGANIVKAQSYNSALGIQVGSVMGVNYKSFVTNAGALEADLSYVINRGVMATCVYQHHFTLANNFTFYLGGGFNIGGLNLGKDREGKFAFGVDPNLGFEYDIVNSPIALAIDYRPMINFTTSSRFDVASFRVRFKL